MVAADDDRQDGRDLLARIVAVEGAELAKLGRNGERLVVVLVSEGLRRARIEGGSAWGRPVSSRYVLP